MKTYVVQKGDTVRKVAEKFQVRLFDLLLNNVGLKAATSYIYPGETLFIPELKEKVTLRKSSFECTTEYGPIDLEEDLAILREQNLKKDIQIYSIGKSVLEHTLYCIKIGTGKKEIFYSGGWHANEWLTTKFLMTFIKELIVNYQKGTTWYGYDLEKIFTEVTLFVVPLVNPDGVELVQQGIYPGHRFYEEVLTINKGATQFDHWSSNIRGVDLNHQWPAGWEVEAEESPQQPWPRHFSGTNPLTEPEAKAIYKLTIRQNFSHVLAFHSQGQVIYWGYKDLEPPESEEMVKKLSLVSSYLPVKTADSDGGYKDWFIQETRRPGFTIEVGVGTNPLPLTAFAEIWSNNVLLALEGLVI